MKKVLFACIISAAMIAPAHAEGPYIGMGVSIFDQPNKSGTQASLNLLGGYDFSQTWGVEAGTMAVPHFQANDGALRLGEARGRSTYVAAKATMPINDKLSFVTKLGVAHTRLKFDGIAAGHNPSGQTYRDSSTGLYLGVGLQYAVTEKFSLALALESRGSHAQSKGGPKAETLSLNALYKF